MRQPNAIHLRITLASALSLAAAVSYGGDLDDGIGIDENINDSLQSSPNLEFIVNHAKAKAKQGSGNGAITDGGVGNITIGAGSDLKGATIINLSDNEDAAVVAE